MEIRPLTTADDLTAQLDLGERASGWMAAAAPGTLRALLALLAGHSSTAGTVELRTSPHSPLWWALRERDAKLVKERDVDAARRQHAGSGGREGIRGRYHRGRARSRR